MFSNPDNSKPAFNRRQTTVVLYASVVAFLTYASIFAYRKPFTVATFDGLVFWGVSYQTLLIISQGAGYMISKFYGIKFIAELKRIGRWKTSAVLVGTAWLSLFFFGLTPPPFGMIFLFVNGFVLGFMWGVIFSYAEGRRTTDFIGASIAVSFIFAGGFSRSVAKWLLIRWDVSEQWMPFMTGLVFALPLVIFLFLLERVPPPDEEDVKARTVRLPMMKEERKHFLRLFGWGIAFVTVTYIFLTVMREIRDNYMANLWNELGYGADYSVFTKTETTTSLIVLIIMGMLVLVRKNVNAFRIIHLLIISGFLLSGISSWLFITGKISGALWMQLASLGLYMGYIPFNCVFFERLIASFRIKGNVGFLIYIADAYGYLASMAVMLTKEFMDFRLRWTDFFSQGVIVLCMFGIAGTFLSLFYFNGKYRLIVK